MGAAILTLVIQCGSAAWIALQSGHQVSLGRWAVFPYLQISTTSVRDFSDIVFWSSVVSALVLSLYAISALIRFRPLQTQMGRSFAFLDISLIGFLAMTSALWFDRRQVYSDWMLHLFLGGGIAFIVAAWIVRDRYRDREALRAQKQHSHASAET